MELEELEIKKKLLTTTLLRSARILRRVLETRRFSVTQTPVKDHQLTLM